MKQDTAIDAPGVQTAGMEGAPRRIIDAALHEFAVRGIDATRIKDIIERADVSKQLFYYYFESKEELYRLALEKTADDAITDILSHDYDEGTAEDGLIAYFQYVFRQYMDIPVLAKFTTDQDNNLGAQISRRNKLRSLTPALVELVKHLIERGQRAGEFRDDIDVEFFYTSSLLMLRGCFVSSCTVGIVAPSQVERSDWLLGWRDNCIAFTLNAIRHPDRHAEATPEPVAPTPCA